MFYSFRGTPHALKTVITVSLALLVGCGEGSVNNLDQLQGVNGQNLCHLTNQVLNTALQEHLVYGPEDMAQVYSLALNSLLRAEGFIPSSSEAYQVSKQVFNSQGMADPARLSDCSDLALIQHTRNRVMSSMDIVGVSTTEELGNQAIFVRFLDHALKNLDYYSGFRPRTRSGTYDFGIRFDLTAAQRYRIERLSEWKILTIRDRESPLREGDRLVGWRLSAGGPITFVKDIPPMAANVEAVFNSNPERTLDLIVRRKNIASEIEMEVTIKGQPRYGYAPDAPLVTSTLAGDLIYLRLTTFEQGASQQLLGHLSKQLRVWEESETRAALAGNRPHRDRSTPVVLLDLRFNPGGLVTEALKVIGLFVPQQSVGLAEYRREQLELMSVESGDIFANPLIVMLNHASASASELTAQGLQESGRALLAGEKSFGKFIGQQTRDVSLNGMGHFGRMVVTTFRIFGVSGLNPQGEGLEVDIPLPQPKIWAEARDNFLKKCAEMNEGCDFRMTNLKTLDRKRFIEAGRPKKYASERPLPPRLSEVCLAEMRQPTNDGAPIIDIDEGTRALSEIANGWIKLGCSMP